MIAKKVRRFMARRLHVGKNSIKYIAGHTDEYGNQIAWAHYMGRFYAIFVDKCNNIRYF